MSDGAWYSQGRIIQCKFEWPNHPKWAVLLGEVKDCTYKPLLLFVRFNSRISDDTRKNKNLLPLQFPVKKADYTFLTKDHGFIDCSRIMTKPYYELLAELDGYGECTAEDCGDLLPAHWTEVLEKVLRSPLLNEAYEEAIHNGL